MEVGTMKRRLITVVSLLCLSVSITSPQAWGWGATGHKLVAEVGGELNGAKSFWSANQVNMGILANVPDNTWKTGKNGFDEKPTHFFEPDAYYSSIYDISKFPRRWVDALRQFSEEKLIDHGTAIWRIQQLYALVISKAITSDYKSSLEMAGTMSHYVGDLSQPLHVTTNYNGQLTNQKGIHKFFETTNLEGRAYATLKADVLKRAKLLIKNREFVRQNTGSLDNVIFNMVKRSYEWKDAILEVDALYGRTGRGATEMYDIAKDRLADGAATLAVILSSAWTAAGNPTKTQSIKVGVPSWLAPNYAGLKNKSIMRAHNFADDHEDDCE